MKSTTLLAVAGGIIINSLGISKTDKKNDIFLKADQKYHEKKCCAQAHLHKHKAVCSQVV